MPDTAHIGDHVPIAQDDAAFEAWPDGLRDEMLANRDNGCVGSVLVSETERVRVWHLRLAPGERCAFHRHVNPYFWTVHGDGRARAYAASGAVTETAYRDGDTAHFHYDEGQSMMHSLENVGETELLFTTVEHLDGPNTPLTVPDEVRRRALPAGDPRPSAGVGYSSP